MKKNPTKSYVFFPGQDDWELWTRKSNGSLIHVENFPDELSYPNERESHRGFVQQISAFYILPIWLSVPKEMILSGIKMYLESQRIQIPNDNSIEYEIIETKDGKSLVLTRILMEQGDKFADNSLIPDTFYSPLSHFDLPQNHIILFRELGKYCIAITQKGKLTFLSTLLNKELEGEMAMEIGQIVYPLIFQKNVTNVESIIYWGEEELSPVFSQVTRIKVTLVAPPRPKWPGEKVSQAIPNSLQNKINKGVESKKRKKLLIKGLYVFAATLLIILLISTFFKVQRSIYKKKIAKLLPRTKKISMLKQKWNEVAPALDVESFPLDLLLFIRSSDYSKNVKLTNFSYNYKTIVIEGSTNSPSFALKFGEFITTSDKFQKYIWDFPAPIILQNNQSKFIITGRLASEATQ